MKSGYALFAAALLLWIAVQMSLRIGQWTDSAEIGFDLISKSLSYAAVFFVLGYGAGRASRGKK